MRILVAEFVQTEPATIGDFLRAGDGVRMAGEQPGHFFRRLKMPHDGSFAAIAEFVDGAALADAGQHILQDAPAGRVIQHVVGGDGRHAECRVRCRRWCAAGPRRWAGASMSGRHRHDRRNPLSGDGCLPRSGRCRGWRSGLPPPLPDPASAVRICPCRRGLSPRSAGGSGGNTPPGLSDRPAPTGRPPDPAGSRRSAGCPPPSPADAPARCRPGSSGR